MARKLIVANWKMNPSSAKEAGQIFSGISSTIKNVKNVSVVVCAPFVFISDLKKKSSKKLSLGAQNVSSLGEGAYTGEVSAKMLKTSGVSYVIVGHSERRAMGESNEEINKKILQALKNKLIPILCVGENERDHSGFYLGFLKKQIHECLAHIPKPQMKNVSSAYEPVWAVGKNAVREATAEEFTEMSIFIKKVISDMYDSKIAHEVKVLYGGSVHPENAKTFLSTVHSSGLLVGRDGLNPKKFGKIVAIADLIK